MLLPDAIKSIRRAQDMTDDTHSGEEELPDWPFENITPEIYWSLPEAELVGIEQIIRDLMHKTNTKH